MTRNAAEKQNVRFVGDSDIINSSDSLVIVLKPLLAVVRSAVRGIMAAFERSGHELRIAHRHSKCKKNLTGHCDPKRHTADICLCPCVIEMAVPSTA